MCSCCAVNVLLPCVVYLLSRGGDQCGDGDDLRVRRQHVGGRLIGRHEDLGLRVFLLETIGEVHDWAAAAAAAGGGQDGSKEMPENKKVRDV